MISVTEIFPSYLATKTSNIDLEPIANKCLALEQESEGVKISNLNRALDKLMKRKRNYGQ